VDDDGLTYIWMPADLLDNILIEVARVAQQSTGDVVCVFQTLEDRLLEWESATLSQLHPLRHCVGVDVLHPEVVVPRSLFRDMFLEDDHVGIGNFFRVEGRDNGGCFIVDGVDDDWRASRQQWQKGETEEILHGGSLEELGKWRKGQSGSMQRTPHLSWKGKAMK
jgi:hypothetical protein